MTRPIRRWVIDTNVVVAGLINPRGAPARVLALGLEGLYTPLVDDRILAEYSDVLTRPRFGFDPALVDALLVGWQVGAERIVAAPIDRTVLPDPGDAAFIEVARTAGASALVMGNAKHFPAEVMGGVDVLSPAEALEVLADTSG